MTHRDSKTFFFRMNDFYRNIMLCLINYWLAGILSFCACYSQLGLEKFKEAWYVYIYHYIISASNKTLFLVFSMFMLTLKTNQFHFSSKYSPFFQNISQQSYKIAKNESFLFFMRSHHMFITHPKQRSQYLWTENLLIKNEEKHWKY